MFLTAKPYSLPLMKKTLSFLAALALSTAAAFAQSNILVGDMNDDGQLTVGDVTALTETVVGRQAVRRVNVAGDPYVIDNTSIVGLWSGVSGTITFRPDGTTDYKDGYTYKYLPSQCLVVFYDETKAAKEFLEVVILKSDELVLCDVSMTKAYTYGEHLFIAEDGSTYYKDANGRRYVDLGLPSGTLWATCNVGADTPEDYGYYFAWGETQPKSMYNWSTYKWMKEGYSDWKGCSKYTVADNQTSGCWYNNGTFIGDNKTELDLEDDAAYMNWGEGWRMPSDAQLTELRTNCIWTWTTQNGKNGYLVKSKNNGASLFLPAAGYYYDSSLYDAGSNGYYWSRSLYSGYSLSAYYVYFNSGGVLRDGNGRYYGRSVRPVRQN